ncbi:MAG TPA: AsmA-like C-terminal region-containing protein [Alphaproteobacteria bacterium]
MRRLFVVVGLALGVAALAIALAPWLVDASVYRAEIARRLEAATGRPATIEGAVDVVFFPSPRIRAGQVLLAEAPQQAGPSVTVRLVEFELGWGALFDDRPTLERLRLVEPEIIVRAAGPSLPALAMDDWALRFERADIDDGRVVWSDAAGNVRETVEHVRARILVAEAGGLRINGSAVAAGAPLEFDVAVGDRAAAGARPFAATVTLRPGLARATIRGTGGVGDNAGMRGRVQIEGADLAAAVRAMGLEAAFGDGMAPGVLDQPFSASAEMTSDGVDFAANDLAIRLGEMSATGAVSVRLAATPVVDLALTMTWLDLDRLRPGTRAATPAPGNGRPQTDGAVVTRIPAVPQALRAAVPKNLDASIDVAIEAIGVHGAIIRQTRLNAALSRGELVVNEVAAVLPGETEFSGFGQLTFDGGSARVEGAATFQSDNLRGLLRWFGVEAGAVPADRLRRIEGSTRIAGRLDHLEFTGIDVRIDSSRLRGGVAFVPGPRPGFGIDLTLDQLNLDGYVGAPGTGAGTGADSQGRSLREVISACDANLRLQAGFVTAAGIAIRDVALDATLNRDGLDIRALNLRDIAGASLRASGRVDSLSSDPALALDVELDAPEPGRLLRLADIPLPDVAPPLRARGHMRAGPGDGIVVENLAFALGEVELSGNARLELLPRPQLHADLSAGVLPFEAPVVATLRAASLPVATELHLSASKLDLGDQAVEEARLSIESQPGAAVATRLQGRLYDGTLELAMRLDDPRQPIAGTLMLTDVDLARMVKHLTGSGAVAGRGDLRADLSIEAGTAAPSWAMVSGTLTVAGRNGSIAGADLMAMRDRLRGSEPQHDIVSLLGTGLSGGSTRYERLTATASIDRGVVRSEDLRVETEVGVVQAGGTLDLGLRTIDAALTVPVSDRDGVPPLGVTLAGRLDDAHVGIDFARLQDYLRRQRAAVPSPDGTQP